MGKLMIAAIKSGSGKTMITCGLLKALKNREINVVSYKCGPDYIDPMFHRKIIGVPSRNVDTFFLEENQLKTLFQETSNVYDESIIEGVMGLYDGVGGQQEQGSSYHVAKILNCPIILVIDVGGMGRSILPLIYGFLKYDINKLIKGVILNRVSETYGKTLKKMIEEELDIKVYGTLKKDISLSFESRHLGLVMPNEIDDLNKKISKLAVEIEKTVDIDSLLKLSNFDKQNYNQDYNKVNKKNNVELENEKEICRLAVARDEAFCFYYEENLEMLKNRGVQLVEFSPIRDKKLPDNIDGILLGGGYPELYLEQLSKNYAIKKDIKEKVQNNIPLVAECGGYMYLHDFVEYENSYEMLGILSGKCVYRNKLVNFGYVEVKENTSSFLSNKTAKAHEFHYFESLREDCSCSVKKVSNDKKWNGCYVTDNIWAGFPHLYYPQIVNFVDNFVEKMINYKKNNHSTKSNYVYGIGVGPGNINKLTSEAKEVIRDAYRIIIPTKELESSYAYNIIKKEFPKIDKDIFVAIDFPMTKDKEILEKAHNYCYKVIKDAYNMNKKVAFVTIGDVCIYSTFNYISAKCDSDNIPVKLINGIPSFCAVAAELGIPLADKSEQIHIIPASYEIETTKNLRGTRVYMKSGSKLLKLQEMLKDEKRYRKTVIYGVSNCGLDNQKVVMGVENLDKLEGYLTTVIVKDLEPFEDKSSSSFFTNYACKYYPCHKNIKNLNCLFCYCPMYFLDECLGHPTYIEKEGKKIKVCTNCVFPHKHENYDIIMKYLASKCRR
ncbi:cobyrinate a,c-diamide synthase [Lachnobacterium bovis]|uniref:cobyrinate a,c-diamide synthase n=1 Tax=Lachnobacterium bovis TaxID=140626 RepID=UPI000683D6ED|nr:cobyrinate a,c-diamide synthase [Lachnobacterium bovis]